MPSRASETFSPKGTETCSKDMPEDWISRATSMPGRRRSVTVYRLAGRSLITLPYLLSVEPVVDPA